MRKRITIWTCIAAFAAMASGAFLRAQSAAPWFGVPLPPGLGDPHKPVTDTRTLSPAKAVVPAGEEGYRELEGAAVWNRVEVRARPHLGRIRIGSPSPPEEISGRIPRDLQARLVDGRGPLGSPRRRDRRHALHSLRPSH